MLSTVSLYAHLAALLAYGALAVVLFLRSSKSRLTACFVVAAALTGAWSGTVALSQWVLLPRWVPELLGPIRDGSWYAIALAVLYFVGEDRRQWWFATAAVATMVSLSAVFAAGHLDLGAILGVHIDSRAVGAAEVSLGFVLLENMLRNVDRDRYWSTKHFGIALGAALLFQALVFVPRLLTSVAPAAMVAAQPLLYLLLIPLFVVSAVRSPDIELRVHSSRKVVFQTTALIAIGVVLQGTAIAAYYLRTRGGDNGTVFGILLGFGSVVGIAVALSSKTIRSLIATFINENFFNYKYDYRLEWQNFIRAVSEWRDDDVPLGVLRTLAELLDSTGGALWVWRDRWNRFMPAAHWCLNADFLPITATDASVRDLENPGCTLVDLRTPANDTFCAAWRQKYPDGWLLVPFRYRHSLVGFALINCPRTPRGLQWEDKNLISLIALQLAAYLVQHETAQALADARQLEEFNKRFAFILHDTKNAIGQLKLLVRNAEQFGDNEEFRRDMIATLRNSVEKLQGLLASLTRDTPRTKSAVTEHVDVSKLVASFAQEKRRLGLNVTVNAAGVGSWARLNDTNAFLAVLEHIVSNGLESSPADAPVAVQVSKRSGFVCVVIEDKGPGMSDQFIADVLFRPRKSTKSSGFGIGAYQAREIMRDLGGDIEVRSKPGQGTAVTLTVPEFVSEFEVV